MKRVLFLLLCLCSCFVSNAQLLNNNILIKQTGYPETLPALSELNYEFTSDTKHHVARVDSPMVITLNIPDSYTINWAIIESSSIHKPAGDTIRGDTIATGTTNQITWTPTDAHFGKSYDVTVDASWGSGGLSRWLGRHTIRDVLDSIYDEADPAITVFDLSSASGFYTSPPATNRVIFKGVRTSGSMNIANWAGVRIQIQTDAGTPAQIGGSGGNLRLRYGNRGLVIDGCTDPDTLYALTVTPSTAIDAVTIESGASGESFTDSITVCGVLGLGDGTFSSGATTGFHISAYQTGPNPGQSSTHLYGYKLFNCRAQGVQNEGFYLNWTRDYEGHTQLFWPTYYYLYADSCGWDGFQPGNSDSVEVHNLYVTNSGLAVNPAQYSDFSINGVSGWFHHIQMIDGHKGFTGSTGVHHGGVHIFDTYVHGVFDDPGGTVPHNWYRLGDNSDFAPDSTVDFAIYRSTFDTFESPWTAFCNGCDETQGDSLRFQSSEYDEENSYPGTAYTAPVANWISKTDTLYTRHWLADFDSAGYRTFGSVPFHAIYNFAGLGANNSDADTVAIKDDTKSTTNESYSVGPSGVVVIAVNGDLGGPPTLTSTQYWGFKSGSTSKITNQTVTGTNILGNAILSSADFSDATPAGIRFENLPIGTYNVEVYSLRTGTATTRTTQVSVNGGSTVDITSNNSGTNDVLTSKVQGTHYALFSDITITDGVIYLLFDPIGTGFCYVNAIELTKQ